MNWGFLGSEPAVRAAQGSLRADRAAQTYLITGPPGIGRRTFAIRLAQEIWCAGLPNPIQDSDSFRFLDDTNPMWRTAVRRGHPDENQDPEFLERSNVTKDKIGWIREKLDWVITAHNDLHVLRRADNKQEIAIQGVREWASSLYLKPATQRVRIGLIDAAHEMSAASANALLKLLEEPAEHAVLILIAPQASDLLPTIVSRCRVIDLTRVATSEISAHLVQHHDLDSDSATNIANASAGRPGWAIRMACDQAAWMRHVDAQAEAADFESATVPVRFWAASHALSPGRVTAQTKEALAWLGTIEIEQSKKLRLAMNSHNANATSEERAHLVNAAGRLLRLNETRRALNQNVAPRLALEDLALRPTMERPRSTQNSHGYH